MIGLYCPDLPPTPGGVADHTLALARALERLGRPPAVLGRRGAPERFAPLPCRVGVRPADLPAAARQAGVRTLVVQYVPFLYSRLGVAPGLPRALAHASRDGLQLAVIVHEPFVPLTRLPWLLTGPLQRLQLATVLRHATRAYAPAPAFAELARRYAGHSLEVGVIPSGAVLPVSQLSREEARRALGIKPDQTAVGIFSPAASGFLHEWIAAAARRLAPSPQVVWIRFGLGSERERPGYPSAAASLVMGPGDAEAPGRIMRALDLALAPYVDGLTLRRTGAMLALAHGVATVSSRGPLFDPLAGELADCLPTAETFAERVAVLGRDEAARRELASRAARFSELASVDVAARRLVSDLAEPKR